MDQIAATKGGVEMAQLLCSRVCHDLVGPAGALSAGLEMVEEGAADDEALGLLTTCGDTINRRLAFFRAAFGFSGGAVVGFKQSDLEALCVGGLEKAGLSFNWPKMAHAIETIPAPWGKLLLNMALMAEESLPRGGEITIQAVRLPEGSAIALDAVGRGARLRDDLGGALALDPAVPLAPGDVTARNVHAAFAQRLAHVEGGRIMTEAIECTGDDAGVRLVVLFPEPHE